MTRRFWLPPGHATELAQHALEAAGWTPADDTNWLLAWTLDYPAPTTFATAADGRWVNHVRGIGALTMKSRLAVTLRRARQSAAAAGADSLWRCAPDTYVLPAEWDPWMRARAWEPDAVWIQKPSDLSRGRGVALVGSLDEVANRPLVVQRYIDNPHLLDGYKYSLRFYVLVASVQPLVAYLFTDGFTKLASRPFSLAPADRADRFRHLTNPDILRDDPEAQGVSARNTTHRAYRERLRREGVDDAQLWTDIRRVLAATVGAALPALRAAGPQPGLTPKGQFELLGIDVALDAHLKPWILECNLSPSLSVEASPASDASRDEFDIKRGVVRDTLHVLGITDADTPLEPPIDAAGAIARVAWHDSRCGGFERLWPSREALEVLAGVDELDPLDHALLAHEAASGGWPRVEANAVDTISLGAETLLFERPGASSRPASGRITLLDPEEGRAWQALTAGSPPAAHDVGAWEHGVVWLWEGLLAAAGPAEGPAEGPAKAGHYTRNGWNRERVYALHGLRVAIRCATLQQEAAIDRVLAWWDASGEDSVDATLFVPAGQPVSDLLAEVNRLALRHNNGVVRRSLGVASKGGTHVLVLGGGEARRAFEQGGWTLSTRRVMVGGSPFGVWADDEHGLPQRLEVTAVSGASASHGGLLMDLVTAGPGVVEGFTTESVRALAHWISALAVWSTANPGT